MTITLAAAMNCVNAAASRRFHTQQLLRRLVVRAAFSPACACRHFAVSAAVSAKGTRSKSRLRTTNHAALHEDAEEEKQQATPTVSIHNDKTHTHSQLLSPQLSAVHGAASKSSTPAMRQWQQLKRANPKHLLLFRLGDFYELFDDDAIQAAQTLQLTLTKRNKHLMAGFPHFSLPQQLHKLVAARLSVAIAEQMEGSSDQQMQRTRKAQLAMGMQPNANQGVIKRRVVRIVTRGTLVDESFLNPKANNYLLAIRYERNVQRSDSQSNTEPSDVESEDSQFDYSLCWSDISTGHMDHQSCATLSQLKNELARLEPAEILLSQNVYAEAPQVARALENYYVTHREASVFDAQLIESHLQTIRQSSNLPQRTNAAATPTPGSASQAASAESQPVDTAVSQSLLGPLQMTRQLSLTELSLHELQLTLSSGELDACAALLDYVLYTQQTSSCPRLHAPQSVYDIESRMLASSASTKDSASNQHQLRSAASQAGKVMLLDASTRRSLELSTSLSLSHNNANSFATHSNGTLSGFGLQSSFASGSSRIGSLLHCIDQTCSNAGARLLAAQLAAPSCDVATINARLDAVSYVFERPLLAHHARAQLRQLHDVERALQRCAMRRASARELRAIQRTIVLARQLSQFCAEQHAATTGGSGSGTASLPLLLSSYLQCMQNAELQQLAARIDVAIVEEPPLLLDDVNFIRSGYDSALDELRSLRRSSGRQVSELESQYRAQTKCNALKIRHNNAMGYFVELSALKLRQLSAPLPVDFALCQQLKSDYRYKTHALVQLQVAVNSAADRAKERELALFETLRADVVQHAQSIAALAHALASLDVHVALAQLARDSNYVRPEVLPSHERPDGSIEQIFDVRLGRHATVEARMRQRPAKVAQTTTASDAESASAAALYTDFVANDCHLSSSQSRLWLITGSNASGKSCYLRQNACIAILAQMGSFVPAAFARLSVIDRIFTRIGASDDITNDISTFMNECRETAAILRDATPRSLVIVDEIGRGTSHHDGLSLAQATLEYLHSHNRCLTLFATHYQELADCAAELRAMHCYKMAVLIKDGSAEEAEDAKGTDDPVSLASQALVIPAAPQHSLKHTVQTDDSQHDIVFLHRLVPGVISSSHGIRVAQMARMPKQVTQRARQLALMQLQRQRRIQQMQ